MQRGTVFLAAIALFLVAFPGFVAAPYGYGNARAAGCGNGLCDGGENNLTCPKDCTKATAYCGDYVCSNEESKTNCPQDCGAYEVCGDTVCFGLETSYNCPLDCGLPAECGNKVCDQKENSYNCPVDCGYAETCGNGLCDPQENGYNCLADCKRTQYRCGDGICDGREDSFNCPLDCGTPSTCGNNVCDPPRESVYNCPNDCGEISTCGNGACEDQENAYNCPRDCTVKTPGNSFESAVLVTDEVFDRKYTKNNVRDFFKLQLRGGEQLNVSSTCAPLYWGPSHRSTPAVFIYNENKDLLAKQSVALKEKTDNKEIRVSWATNSGKPGQLLYVEVGPESAWQREFTCTTKFVVAPLLDLEGKGDAPDSFEGAFEVKPGLYEENWLVGGDEGADERDFYQLKLRRGDKAEIKAVPSKGAEMGIQLYDASFRPLAVKPFMARGETVATYVSTQGEIIYFSVSRIKSGRYALSVGTQPVDLCYYVKCAEGEQCVNGNCVNPSAPQGAQGGATTAPGIAGPSAPAAPHAPRQSIFDGIISFFRSLFGGR